MFKLIKWLILLILFGSIFYLGYFFWHLNPSDKEKVKKDAIEAIESEDINALTGPLSKRIKKDLLEKKESFTKRLKSKLKELINDLLDAK